MRIRNKALLSVTVAVVLLAATYGTVCAIRAVWNAVACDSGARINLVERRIDRLDSLMNLHEQQLELLEYRKAAQR